METVLNGNHIAMAVAMAIGLFSQMSALNLVADVIATLYCYICVADVMATSVEQVAGVVAKCNRWNSHMSDAYFILSSEVLNRTSSHI